MDNWKMKSNQMNYNLTKMKSDQMIYYSNQMIYNLSQMKMRPDDVFPEEDEK